MLIRSGRSVIRSITRLPILCQIQPVRFRNDYGHAKNVKRYRNIDWIGNQKLFNEDKKDKPKHIPRELKVRTEESLYFKNETFKKLLDDAYNVIKEKVLRNDFQYKQYDHGIVYKHSSIESLGRLRSELSEWLNEFQGEEEYNLALENLINPISKDIPHLTYKIINQDSNLLSKFLNRKGLIEQDEQVDYFFEQTFHSIMHKQLIADLPAQDINVDISNPEEWYPEARKIRRKLILHMGPTNSGKTYHALQRLKQSNDGYYAGPLRLLAREIYDKFKSEGIRCNLVTGEEVIEDRDESGIEASLSSGTVEMIPVNQRFEVVVLDEIQMIADKFRGWAWSHALLGAQADEIHLCGEESVIPLIKRIAETTGDEVIINRYERLGELQIEDQPVTGGLNGLEKGDCIVAFSKKRIMAYKEEIQNKTDLKCGVIYGALPAETRATEAERFNNGEYDVLVASDAIGMGLNLSINRVIFDSHKKFDGDQLRALESPQVKQIGGRAGRFKAPGADGKKSKSLGKISAFYPDTLEFIRESMSTPTIFLERADVWPSDTIWSLYTSTFPKQTRLKIVLETFHKNVEDTKLYRISTLRDRLEVAHALNEISNSMLVGDQLRMSTAPLSSTLPRYHAVIEHFGNNVIHGFTKSILDFAFLNFSCLNRPARQDDLSTYEELHKYVLLFLWMHNRYPSYFVDRECAVEIKDSLESKIEAALRGKKHKRMGIIRDSKDSDAVNMEENQFYKNNSHPKSFNNRSNDKFQNRFDNKSNNRFERNSRDNTRGFNNRSNDRNQNRFDNESNNRFERGSRDNTRDFAQRKSYNDKNRFQSFNDAPRDRYQKSYNKNSRANDSYGSRNQNRSFGDRNVNNKRWN
ncbi:ATP-dependent RNA helicase [Wickerhamomyces ciferrii]|uniref:ATP-dependent RNA helicase SUV3, mitochondrial n=1 Tax=Wickerhamomyces ciferrii (strain ATCC 14091 / BCRC 22168 / CBS 111 / JCM 3599 / NBRC 0793 / NRRL Y-1031 F-60-10) TaxID=1206466 RepID=K0KDQ1_WICCF|nr:ATP-dependent RNA helicase [Wickerhamomyces ciferrii]CCH41051.1 ATP-dependent RNA helicase [Wickerhamomyces ciferrii]